jgi:hypothetical protein
VHVVAERVRGRCRRLPRRGRAPESPPSGAELDASATAAAIGERFAVPSRVEVAAVASGPGHPRVERQDRKHGACELHGRPALLVADSLPPPSW